MEQTTNNGAIGLLSKTIKNIKMEGKPFSLIAFYKLFT